ncbi:dihydrodipicolinate reductase, family protein [Neorickettsia helminthoeca str. Oregon]|uniref:Dihydrodipicolinate reductase, family protein n=1 Tax=Neorickettsia helminthoeca str. Oregon TaxID=1286528 RepID=X5GXB4_9RICK|nr:dihydrodipicolinate reductase, family protein [Neorickettsia helminthoeca str. Oregon]
MHGKHSIIFVGDGETLEIIHTAENRGAFALGAMKAARFLATAPSGLYSMKDVLNYAF